jgi:uncharacterized membrane protein
MLVLLPLAAWEFVQADTPAWTPQATLLVVAAGLLPGIGAYWAYGFCQKVLGASRVAASLYLGPLYGGLAAWLVLGETMGWHHAMGAALILPGIYLASMAQPMGCSLEDAIFRMAHHRVLGGCSAHGHFQIAPHSRVVLDHLPQALLGTTMGQLRRPGIQPNHQLVRQSAGQATQKHDGQDRKPPQHHVGRQQMGIGPTLHQAIGHDTHSANACGQQDRGQQSGGCCGRCCNHRLAPRWAWHGGGDGFHFVFPEMEWV